jgi:serine/threonine protein phosphatase PrpC
LTIAGEGDRPVDDDDDDDDDDSTARPLMAASSSSSSRPPPPPTTAIRLTRDHKSTDPDEVDRIVKSGGFVVRGRVLGVLAVARSIGDHGLKEYVIGRPHVSSTVVRIVDYYDDDDEDNDGDRRDRSDEDDHDDEKGEGGEGEDAPYTDGEFLIVACDGLWDVMGDQEAVDLVRGHACGRRRRRDGGREGASSFLVGEALRRGSADNITVVVYWL